MTPIRDQLQTALADALRSRDAVRMSVLRSTLSAIANAEAVEVQTGTTATEMPRRQLTEADVRAVVTSELAELEAAAAQMRTHGHAERSASLEQKAAILADTLAQA